MTATNQGTHARLRKPVLSICVTTYNRAAWLEKTLPLILREARAYPDLVEVVVCDNTSTDRTPEVTERFRATASIRVHRNERNVGMLGNLAVSASQARGGWVWVIGDDDLVVEGTVDRVLAAIGAHPETELVYTNYAYTSFDHPGALGSVDAVIHGALPISPAIDDVFTLHARDLCAKSINCFTSIYCVVFRADHAVSAFGQDTSGPPFSSLATCVPTTKYVIEHLFDRPAYWIGDPCVVVNYNVSWNRYASLYLLERFPEIFDRMEAAGASRVDVDELRAKHAPVLARWVYEVYFGGQREHVASFSMERLVSRFAHVAAFRDEWPRLRRVYAEAHERGLAGATAVALPVLDAVVAGAGASARGA
jgi:glycosyltransferase involved in cell wall biosynthesis